MTRIVDRAYMTVSGTPGTGTITLGSAVTSYQTFAAAGVVDADVVSYLIIDGTAWEYGRGTYTSSGTTLARTTVIASSNANAAISATSAAQVALTVLKEDLVPGSSGNILINDGAGGIGTIGTVFAGGTTYFPGTVAITGGGAFYSSSFSANSPVNEVVNQASDATCGQFFFVKQRGTSTTLNGDKLMEFVGQGTDSANALATAGSFKLQQNGAAGSGSVPAVWQFVIGATSLSLPAATDTVVARATTDDMSGKRITLAAGSTSVGPLVFTSGTNLTTATAGAWEYDGSAYYSTHAANERGVVPSEQIEILSAAYTLTSQTAAQKLLNATTNGALTLAVGTYEIECIFSLSAMSATSGSFGFALGGTATKTQMWRASANKAALVTPTSMTDTLNTAANTALTAANTTTTGYAYISGYIRVTVAGTVIPQVSLGVAAAAIVGANSYFKVSPIGSGTVTTVGNWS